MRASGSRRRRSREAQVAVGSIAPAGSSSCRSSSRRRRRRCIAVDADVVAVAAMFRGVPSSLSSSFSSYSLLALKVARKRTVNAKSRTTQTP